MRPLFTSNFKSAGLVRALVKAALFAFFLLAILAVVASQNEFVWKKLVVDPCYDGPYFLGDLYCMSFIKDFKEQINQRPLLPAASGPNSAKYVIKADSFFSTGYDSEPVYNYLQGRLEGGIYYKLLTTEKGPLDFLKEIEYKKAGPKVFVWETAEFYSLGRITDEGQAVKPAGHKSLVKSLSGLFSSFKPNRGRKEYFFENNFVVQPVRAWLKDKAFHWFGDIDGLTPLYSKNPKMLFLNEEVAFRNNRTKIAQIPQLAGDIAKLSQVLKDDYNLTLVFIIVPNKLSLYADFLPKPNDYGYDDFVPLLQKELAAREVKYVDIYGPFAEHRQTAPADLLFYPGDHHYTPVGKEIFEKQLLKNLPNFSK